jgi:hypothetical protein
MPRFRIYKEPRLPPSSNGPDAGSNGAGPRPEPISTCRVLCPRCGGVMTARVGRAGPYFHCLCYEPANR